MAAIALPSISSVATSSKAKPAAKTAAKELDGIKTRMASARAKAKEYTSVLIHGAETGGSLLLASTAAGYFGPDKMRPWGKKWLDYRLLGGLGGLLLSVFLPKKPNMHGLCLSEGLLLSFGADVGKDVGAYLAKPKAPDQVPGIGEVAFIDESGKLNKAQTAEMAKLEGRLRALRVLEAGGSRKSAHDAKRIIVAPGNGNFSGAGRKHGHARVDLDHDGRMETVRW